MAKPKWPGKEELKAVLKVFNAHNLRDLVGNPACLVWRSRERLRSPGWLVHGQKPSNPSAHWMDNGCHVFGPYDVPERGAAAKVAALALAQAWCKEKYGVEFTEKDPFGAWQPAGTLEKLLKVYEAAKANAAPAAAKE